MSETIIHDGAKDVAEVPGSVVGALVDQAHELGEHATATADHAAKIAEHELTISTQQARIDELTNQIANLPPAIDHEAHMRISQLESELEEAKRKMDEAVVEPVVETVTPPHASHDDDERPKKKSFWHRFI